MNLRDHTEDSSMKRQGGVASYDYLFIASLHSPWSLVDQSEGEFRQNGESQSITTIFLLAHLLPLSLLPMELIRSVDEKREKEGSEHAEYRSIGVKFCTLWEKLFLKILNFNYEFLIICFFLGVLTLKSEYFFIRPRSSARGTWKESKETTQDKFRGNDTEKRGRGKVSTCGLTDSLDSLHKKE